MDIFNIIILIFLVEVISFFINNANQQLAF